MLIVTGIASICAAQSPGSEPFRQEGIASWYGGEFDGKPTASGEIFNSGYYTAAHPTLPFGTILVITNKQNDKRVTVKVNDRGPFVSSRIIDLSRAAADVLDMLTTGTAPVIVERAANTTLGPGGEPVKVAAAAVPQAAPQAPPPAPPVVAQVPAPAPAAPAPVPPPQAPEAAAPQAAAPQPAPAAPPPPAPSPTVPQAQTPPAPASVPAQPAPAAPAPVAAPPAETKVPQAQVPPAAPVVPPVPVVPPAPVTAPAPVVKPPAPVTPAYSLPPAQIKGTIPPAGSTKLYRLQVGAYIVPKNAVDAFDKLKSAGLNPAYERSGDYYRVVLPGLRARDISSISQTIGNLGFKEALIREER